MTTATLTIESATADLDTAITANGNILARLKSGEIVTPDDVAKAGANVTLANLRLEAAEQAVTDRKAQARTERLATIDTDLRALATDPKIKTAYEAFAEALNAYLALAKTRESAFSAQWTTVLHEDAPGYRAAGSQVTTPSGAYELESVPDVVKQTVTRLMSANGFRSL